MMKESKYRFNSAVNDSIARDVILNYVICSTPRSGSTLLSKGLMSTRIAGLPHEYFNVDHKLDYIQRWRVSTLNKYIQLLKQNRISSNGVFGFKIHYHQYASEFENNNMNDYFKDLRYVFIKRKDKLYQGISLEIAHQTNKWSSDFQSDKKPVFRFENIKKRVNEIKTEESNWLDYFKTYNIDPLVVYYEELENDYSSILRRVLDYLDLKFSGPIPPEPIQKQSTVINFIWKKKYQLLNMVK